MIKNERTLETLVNAHRRTFAAPDSLRSGVICAVCFGGGVSCRIWLCFLSLTGELGVRRSSECEGKDKEKKQSAVRFQDKLW
jgi:hypothetical protein